VTFKIPLLLQLFLARPVHPRRKQCSSDEHLLLTVFCLIRSQTGFIPTYYAKPWSFAAGNLWVNLPNFVTIH